MALTQVKSDGIADGAVTTNDLSNSGVTAGTYGSSSAIPAITVDAKGRITSASTNAISVESDRIFEGNTSAEAVDTGSDGHFKVITEGTEALRVDSSQQVGIGTNAPAAKLDVSGNVQFGDGGGFDMNANGTRWQFSLAGTERMRIDSSGRVGIGTTSPISKVHIQRSAVANAPSRDNALYLENNANCEIMMVGNPANDCQIRFGTSSNSFKGALEYQLDVDALLAYTNGSERLRIDSTGINVTGTVTCDGMTCEGSATIASGTGVFFLKDSNSTGIGTQCYISGRDSANSEVWYVGQTSGGTAAVDIVNTQNAAIFFGTNNLYRSYISSSGHYLPNSNNTYDLGSSSQRWRNVYTNDLNLSNEGGANDVDGTWGSWTIQEGEDDLFLLNRRNGKKYKFNLSEVN